MLDMLECLVNYVSCIASIKCFLFQNISAMDHRGHLLKQLFASKSCIHFDILVNSIRNDEFQNRNEHLSYGSYNLTAMNSIMMYYMKIML
jgi:hypothetical protein